MATQTTIDTDVAIIGAGTAGLAAYRAAKAAGKRDAADRRRQARHDLRQRRLHAEQAAHRARGGGACGRALARVRHRCRRGARSIGKAVMERVRAERDRFVGFVTDDVDALPAADKLRGNATLRRRPHAAHRRRRHRPGIEHRHRHRVRRPRIRRHGAASATGSSTNDDVFEWERPAGERRGFRSRRHRTRARPGPASPRRARQGVRPRRRRRSACRIPR